MQSNIHKPSPFAEWLSKPRNLVAIVLSLVVIALGFQACRSTILLNSIEDENQRIHGYR